MNVLVIQLSNLSKIILKLLDNSSSFSSKINVSDVILGIWVVVFGNG